MNETKLTEQELQRIKELHKEMNNIILDLGQIEFDFLELATKKEFVVNRLKKARQEEERIGKELALKYGDGRVNLQDGIFTKIT